MATELYHKTETHQGVLGIGWSPYHPFQDRSGFTARQVLDVVGSGVAIVQGPAHEALNRGRDTHIGIYRGTPEQSWLQDESNVFLSDPGGFIHPSVMYMEPTELIKLERQRREREAGVWLDPVAPNLLSVLNRETSIRWEDVPDRAECEWSEATRAAALLVGANLCEVSPTRIRLSEYGAKLLAESSLTEQANNEVAS